MAPSSKKTGALLKTIQTGIKEDALKVVNEGVAALVEYSAKYDGLFGGDGTKSFSEIQSSLDFAAESPEIVVNAITTTSDVVSSVISKLNLFERFLLLSIPKMEDGNNFGVTIQLAALKQIKDDRKALKDALYGDVLKYYSTRGDLIEKCKLPSTSSSKTTTTVGSDVKSFKEDSSGKTETSTGETKTTESSSTTPEQKLRQQAVVVCDVTHYEKCKSTLFDAITCYAAAVDFIDKNKEKLEKPKGSQGTGHFSSMY